MTPKSWKTRGYIIDFKNGSRCFFPEKGAVSNFFSEKGAVGQKRLGTCGLGERQASKGFKIPGKYEIINYILLHSWCLF
jgi:hypothetical protein